MTNAITGVGTVLSRLVSSAWEALAEVNTISGPGLTKDVIDATSLDSVAGYREYIGGLKDGGELTFDMNFTRDNYEAMLADFEASVTREYQIALQDEAMTEIEFSGFVTGMPLEIPMDDKITISVTIKVTGAPTTASGA